MVPIYNMQPTAYICSQWGTSALRAAEKININEIEADVKAEFIYAFRDLFQSWGRLLFPAFNNVVQRMASFFIYLSNFCIMAIGESV